MPYLNKEFTKKVRQQLKEEFPDVKFSVRTRDHMALDVTVREAPIDLLKDTEDSYESVNQFHVESHYEDFPEKRDFLSRVVEIMRQEQYEEVYDGDYGSVPSYYVSLRIGDWDRPFIHKN